MLPKISFCTTCRDRLYHLEKTLPFNLNHNYPNLEFVLLNYNSSDELDDWVRENMMEHILSGKLVYYKESSAEFFRMSHAKNVSGRLATGEIICNVDADSYVGDGFADELSTMKSKRIMAPRLTSFKIKNWDVSGRIALRKVDFEFLGGYDERMKYGWGYEDLDFKERANRLGFKIQVFNHHKYVKCIKHGGKERHENSEVKNYKSHEAHEQLSKKALSKGEFIANRGMEWGYANLIKNFDLRF